MARRILQFFALAPLLLLAAKCVDNETMYQDSTGRWHVVGEIHNETDVWGAEMLLGGTLYDAAGNVVATSQTGLCPRELAPGTFTAFDLEFRNPAGTPVRYELRMLGGRVLPGLLPDSGLRLPDFTARHASDGGISIAGTVRNDGDRDYTRVLTGCAAVYNAEGRVITHFTLVNFGLTLPLNSRSSQPVAFTLPGFLVESGATHVRLWLAGDADEPFESDYAYTMTESITIQ